MPDKIIVKPFARFADAGGAAGNDAVNFVVTFLQKPGQVITVLAGDAGDECSSLFRFGHDFRLVTGWSFSHSFLSVG